MPLPFLDLSQTDRNAAFVAAAARSGMSTVMIEKDFWVCWLLHVVFTQWGLSEHLVFKGGTSLSKVYAVIERFSEDVDLSLSPELIGSSEAIFDRLSSRTQREQAVLMLQQLAASFVRDQLAPRLEMAIVDQLGPPGASAQWLEFEEDAASHSPVLYFHYPSSQLEGFAYIKRAIRLEFGSLTDQQPVGRHPVLPLVAEHFPTAFEGWRCEVIALDLARTFWEKATILHAEHHRPAQLSIPARYARHYADMAQLLRHPRGTEFLLDSVLCQRVVEWKSRVFARSWARYDRARRPTFRLTPAAERIAELAADYAQMRAMFFTQPQPFAELLGTLSQAEDTLNASSP